MESPPDLLAALRHNAPAEKVFPALPTYRSREEITEITSAKQEPTRQKRIAQLLETLGCLAVH